MKHHSRSHAHATDNTQVRACCATQPVKQERPESKQHATHGHSAKEHSCCSSAKAATASEATHTAVADATASIDPVCGMTVANDSPHSATRGGGRYVFCSAGCRAKFVANPDKYVQASAQDSHAKRAHMRASETEPPAGIARACATTGDARQIVNFPAARIDGVRSFSNAAMSGQRTLPVLQ